MNLFPDEQKPLPIEDSDEENYCYYNENEETDAEELNEIIAQIQDSGIDLSTLFDES